MTTIPNYKENPKAAGSGLISCIPQTSTCPYNCPDCYFQGGDSYLEPLGYNLPNVPTQPHLHQVVRVNDGNDSNNERKTVLTTTEHFPHKFYNTSVPRLDFPGPVVLTINPGLSTDTKFHRVDPIPDNLMFVRFRTNLWNLSLLDKAVMYYCPLHAQGFRRNVPIVLTWMCYPELDSIPKEYKNKYRQEKHVENTYWQVRSGFWHTAMQNHCINPYIHSCGTPYSHLCSHCGNCLREWHATMERLAKES